MKKTFIAGFIVLSMIFYLISGNINFDINAITLGVLYLVLKE